MSGSLQSVMVRQLVAAGEKGRRECAVLFDSGATESFVRRDVAEAVGTILPLDEPQTYSLADGRPYRITEKVSFTLYLKGSPISDVFMVHPATSALAVDDIIMGARTLAKFGLSLDFKHNDIVFSMKTVAAPHPGGRLNAGKEHLAMQDILKRALALIGVENIHDALTDDDALAMIVSRCSNANRYYSAILEKLSLPKDATEPQIHAAIEGLKKATTFVEPDPKPFLKKLLPEIGVPAPDDLTEEAARALILKATKQPAHVVAAKGILTALALPDTATEEEAVGAIYAIKSPGNAISLNDHRELEQQHRAFRLEKLITDAIKDGKAYPYEKETFLMQVKADDERGLDGVAVLDSQIQRRPKLMPMGARLDKPPVEPSPDVVPLNTAKIYAARQAAREKIH